MSQINLIVLATPLGQRKQVDFCQTAILSKDSASHANGTIF